MSILDTFYILFKSDASEVKKGAEEAQKATQNLQDKLKSTDKSAEHLGESFLSATHSALGLVAGIVSVGTVLSGLHSAVSNVQQLGDASRSLGVNVTALDAWGHAVQRTGGSAQEFQSSLVSLADHLKTTPAIALKSLPLFADAFSRMNQAQANMYGKSLGIDQGTIYLLQQGRREVEDTIKQQQKLGLVTKEDVEITRKFDNALYDAGRAFQSFYRSLAMPALPFLTKTFDYLLEHKDLIKGAFLAIGSAIVVVNRAALLLYLRLGLIVGAFALIFEDIAKFNEGAKSVTGVVVKKYQEITGIKPGESGVAPLASPGARILQELLEKFGFLKNSASHDFLLPGIGGQDINNQKTTTISTGPVYIQTQATNGKDVYDALLNGLTNQQYQSNSHFDDAVAR